MRSILLRLARTVALLCLGLYLLVFPGSTLTVALDRIPAWGTWMGGWLLMIQGLAGAAWLLASYGRRGALAGLMLFGLGWGIEHLGETSGFPFGRYQYGELLQPQLGGGVPLPIICAWLTVALGAWQLARITFGHRAQGTRSFAPALALGATLLLVQDLQIETVATLINPYWAWGDSGPYYGVPVANFVAWWVVGFAMAAVLEWVLGGQPLAVSRQPSVVSSATSDQRLSRYIFPLLPALLYTLSTLMFTVVNLARGYTLAGLVGVVFLLVALILADRERLAAALAPVAGQRFDQFPADHA